MKIQIKSVFTSRERQGPQGSFYLVKEFTEGETVRAFVFRYAGLSLLEKAIRLVTLVLRSPVKFLSGDLKITSFDYSLRAKIIRDLQNADLSAKTKAELLRETVGSVNAPTLMAYAQQVKDSTRARC